MKQETTTFIATVADQVTDYAIKYKCTYADAIWDWEGDGPKGSYGLSTEDRVDVSRELRRRGIEYIDDVPAEVAKNATS
mgnify:CR=1 FL=1